MFQALSKTGSFEASHRLMDYDGKCKNVHGHSYHYEVTLHLTEPKTTSQIILDFGDLKAIFHGYVNEFFDHASIVNPADELMLEHLERIDSKMYIMSLNSKYCMTSGENIAKELYLAAELMFAEAEGITVHSLKLSETTNNHTIVYKHSIYPEEKQSFLLEKQYTVNNYIANLEI